MTTTTLTHTDIPTADPADTASPTRLTASRAQRLARIAGGLYVVLAPALVAEFSLVFWLLVRGIDVDRWEDTVR